MCIVPGEERILMTRLNWDKVRIQSLCARHGSMYGSSPSAAPADPPQDANRSARPSREARLSAKRTSATSPLSERGNVWTPPLATVIAKSMRGKNLLAGSQLTGAPASLELLRKFEASLTPAALTRWTRSELQLARRCCQDAADYFDGVVRTRGEDRRRR